MLNSDLPILNQLQALATTATPFSTIAAWLWPLASRNSALKRTSFLLALRYTGSVMTACSQIYIIETTEIQMLLKPVKNSEPRVKCLKFEYQGCQ